MQIAVVLFERFTALDAVGPYQVLSLLPGAETVVVAERAGPVGDDRGSLTMVAGAALTDVPAPDLVVVPGGPGARESSPAARCANGCAPPTPPARGPRRCAPAR
jgi:putative intracellular protease/amidase